MRTACVEERPGTECPPPLRGDVRRHGAVLERIVDVVAEVELVDEEIRIEDGAGLAEERQGRLRPLPAAAVQHQDAPARLLVQQRLEPARPRFVRLDADAEREGVAEREDPRLAGRLRRHVALAHPERVDGDLGAVLERVDAIAGVRAGRLRVADREDEEAQPHLDEPQGDDDRARHQRGDPGDLPEAPPRGHDAHPGPSGLHPLQPLHHFASYTTVSP